MRKKQKKPIRKENHARLDNALCHCNCNEYEVGALNSQHTESKTIDSSKQNKKSTKNDEDG